MNDLRYSVMKDYAFESDRKKKTDIGKILFQIAFAKQVFLLFILNQELNYYIKDLEKIYSDFEEELDYINQHVHFIILLYASLANSMCSRKTINRSLQIRNSEIGITN